MKVTAGIRKRLGFIHSVLVDASRFWNHSYIRRSDVNQRKLQGHILRLSHALEKGAVLPAPRPGFGLVKMVEICQAIDLGASRWGVGAAEKIGFSTVCSILAIHEGQAIKGVAPIKTRLEELSRKFPGLLISDTDKPGIHHISKQTLLQALPKNPEQFFFTRSSVRQFGPRSDFDPLVIRRAVAIAQKTPSVCNRQLGRVYVFDKQDDVIRLLSFQDGNSGFGSDASALAVVTTDISGMYKTGERNQAYVDGGLFAMSLVYACHSLGLGTCMLNWSQTAYKDSQFRKICVIPESEIIITMIAIGPLPDDIVVARSPRLPLDAVLTQNMALHSHSR